MMGVTDNVINRVLQSVWHYQVEKGIRIMLSFGYCNQK
jgi:hypothetical protein